ncbi:MAG: hypothetical protein PF450_10245 [Bacteroidales bacterium]|jgi:hypothetical protein|nr:hypothetical protein [Bacteroidales bacterium]
MTFKEYKEQLDPKRHPDVVIKRDECFSIFPTGIPDVEGVILKINDGFYTYRKSAASTRLYTIDKVGNEKARSVFTLID